MVAQNFVPRFAQTLNVSSVVEANALRALALTGDVGTVETGETDWAPRAAAALIVGASWIGETWTEEVVATATGVPEYELVRHVAKLAEQLEGHEI